MKPNFSHVLMLATALVAFAPVLLVDSAMATYVRGHEQMLLQKTTDGIGRQIQSRVESASASLSALLASGQSLCGPEFKANARDVVQNSLYLRQLAVESADQQQLCDALEQPFVYSTLSETLAIPGSAATLTLVRLGQMDMPAVRISQGVSSRQVSVFLPLLGQELSDLVPDIISGSQLAVVLTNGDPALVIGGAPDFAGKNANPDFITTQSFSGQYPILVQAAVPLAQARTKYADLHAGFTLIAALAGVGLMAFALRYVPRAKVPEVDLERAIGRGEIKPYYQPVINLKTGQLIGCEVLCRWIKPNGTIVSPGVFIDYAEVTGLALPMTISLMQQVKVDMADLAREQPELKFSINLFEGHFRDGTIIDDVQAIFGGSSISFRQLVFEITERRPLGNSTQTNTVINGLHALGSRLAMDDAGTGHSNLAYLQTLGVDIIKIDQVFVAMIKADTTQVPVLDGLIAMARDLGTEVIAEGVETEAQALYLRARGVIFAQGFLFAPALASQSFQDLARALNVPPIPTGGVPTLWSDAA